jgi:DNA repair protein RadC
MAVEVTQDELIVSLTDGRKIVVPLACGALCRAEVEPREILKECLLHGAAAAALFHTNPSGDPTPSSADLLFTRRMAYAAALVGVDLVDHLVLGSMGRRVSLRSQGGW